MKLKICGMRDPENILSVASLRPEYMGFIFYPKSPRYVGEEFEIPAAFSLDIKKVGVFVDATVDEMLKVANNLKLDYLQLHGKEAVSVCAELRKQGVGVIKVFAVGDDFDFSIVRPYQSVVDYFLFDTKGKYYGGNAKKFDWSVLKKYDQQVPFFLSGGISPENIGEVVTLKGMNLHALDANSGVESGPGIKSGELIRELKMEIEKLQN